MQVAVKAQLDVCTPLAGNLYDAFRAEAAQPGTPKKGAVDVIANPDCVSLVISARDVGDARALLNSYLQLLHAAYSVLLSLKTREGDTYASRQGSSRSSVQ